MSDIFTRMKNVLNLQKTAEDRPPVNFQHGYVYAGDQTVISETHFGCQLF